MTRIVLLTEQVLNRMLDDPDFKEFPCLANPPRSAAPSLAAARSRGCGGCGRRRRKAATRAAAGTVNYNEVKRAIINMPAKQQAALKLRLGCTGLKIQWQDPRAVNHRRVI